MLNPYALYCKIRAESVTFKNENCVIIAKIKSLKQATNGFEVTKILF